MLIVDVLRQAQGGTAIANLGHAFGISAEQADSILELVLPELSTRLERNTLSRGGTADLLEALGQGHHEVYVDDPRAATHPDARADGVAILDHIVGKKDASRAIADQAAAASGVPADIIKAMLPVIAGMLMGGLSKSMQGSLGGILGRMGGGATSGGMTVPRMPGSANRPATGGVGLPRQGTSGSANDVLFPQRERPMAPSGSGGQAGSGGWNANGGVRTNSQGGLEMPDGNASGDSGRYRRDQGGMETGGMGSGSVGSGSVGSGDPLPMPGNRVPGIPGNAENPYGDLADILRRGLGLPGGAGSGPVIISIPGGGGMQWPGGNGQQGRGVPRQGGSTDGPLPMPGDPGAGRQMPRGGGIELPSGQVGGGMLWNIIRSVLGGALGFQGGGVMSWLFRMIFMRYGWTILKTILGRGMLGR
jgi:Bacterial protein of unknown function (DUF937)